MRRRHTLRPVGTPLCYGVCWGRPCVVPLFGACERMREHSLFLEDCESERHKRCDFVLRSAFVRRARQFGCPRKLLHQRDGEICPMITTLSRLPQAIPSPRTQEPAESVFVLKAFAFACSHNPPPPSPNATPSKRTERPFSIPPLPAFHPKEVWRERCHVVDIAMGRMIVAVVIHAGAERRVIEGGAKGG